MTYAEAIQFLYGLRWFGAKFGLENTLKLATWAGNPQDQLRFIHVAGTNGKGSTCAMLESIYRAAGLRVGLFTSPHLVSFRERLQVNRQLISEADVVRLVEAMRRTGVAPVSDFRSASEQPEDGDRRDACPTFFEFITVMALCYFAEQKCDLVIWETGLGGRLDATNIVTPLTSVITNIGLDHQQWLGETLEKIAAEKAGIIKPGIPVLTATDEPEALAVIERLAREKGAPLVRVGQASRLSPTAIAPWDEAIMETGATPVLRLAGEHQRRNAALAAATVEALQNQIPVSGDAIRRGLETVHWPGRLQLITRTNGQRVLLDGAHNIAGAEVLRTALGGAPATGAPITLILGILADKDCRAMCEILAPLAAKIRLMSVGSERTAKPAELAPFCRAANPQANVVICDSLPRALARSEGDPFVVIAGSLYLIGEAMELLGLSPVPTADEKALNNWQPTNPPAKTF